MDTLQKETFIPILINTRKGRRACISKPTDNFATTPLSRLLAKAYVYEKRLQANPGISQQKFCELNRISPRYLRGILKFNMLSPKLKNMIMNGWMPKHTSVQQLLTEKMPLSWLEQEKSIY